MGCASGVVHQSGMMGDVDGCVGAEGQRDESLFLLRCLVLEMKLEQLPLLH